jgi:hypothetical protein
VGVVTIRQLEAGSHEPGPATLQAVRDALERAGVEFIDENGGGAGLRLRKASETKPKRKSKLSSSRSTRTDAERPGFFAGPFLL